jgi:hypothetical protein
LDLRGLEVMFVLEDRAHFLEGLAFFEVQFGDEASFPLPFFCAIGVGCASGAALPAFQRDIHGCVGEDEEVVVRIASLHVGAGPVGDRCTFSVSDVSGQCCEHGGQAAIEG